MCKSCWITEYGRADILNDKVLRAVDLIEEIYAVQASAGGTMHCILEDWNLEDFDQHQSVLDLTAEECACYVFMAELTIDERASALARYEEFVV